MLKYTRTKENKKPLLVPKDYSTIEQISEHQEAIKVTLANKDLDSLLLAEQTKLSTILNNIEILKKLEKPIKARLSVLNKCSNSLAGIREEIHELEIIDSVTPAAPMEAMDIQVGTTNSISDLERLADDFKKDLTLKN